MIRKAKKYDILKKAFQTMIIKGQVKTSGCSKTFLLKNVHNKTQK